MRKEIIEHLPYTVFSVAIGFIILGLLNFIAQLTKSSIVYPAYDLYHIFHMLHLLFSASATTSMMCKYGENKIKAILIGLIGSVGICGLSDIFIPYISGLLLNIHMHCHICIIHHPLRILPFLTAGILLGLISHNTKDFIFSHSCHVLISSTASILYLISFGLASYWVHHIGIIFIYVIIAVVVPCCCSDIIFPLLTLKRGTKK